LTRGVVFPLSSNLKKEGLIMDYTEKIRLISQARLIMDYTEKIRLISQAINFENPIAFIYDSGDIRIVNPHCIYTNLKNETCLDAFQTEGDSKTKALDKFKIFKVAKIDNIKIDYDSNFFINSQFNPESVRYLNKIVMIKE
jgi:hypothetical protein